MTGKDDVNFFYTCSDPGINRLLPSKKNYPNRFSVFEISDKFFIFMYKIYFLSDIILKKIDFQRIVVIIKKTG